LQRPAPFAPCYPFAVDADFQPPNTNPRPLVHSFKNQNKIFSAAFDVLQQAVTRQSFPAASIAVTSKGELIALQSFGSFVFEDDVLRNESQGAPPCSRPSREGGEFDPLSPATLFDLASLTKPVATASMAAILYERGLLELDAPITGTVPEFKAHADPRRSQVTFRMLLAHSSGLPAYEKLFLKAHSREDLLHATFTMPLTADPATRAEYSDIGFIILGVALERLAGETLDTFCQREIFGPLAMANTTFNPPPQTRNKIPPTADERNPETCGADTPVRQKSAAQPHPSGSPNNPRSTFRNRIIQGKVQDENASVLGGVAGHAGLFSTAEDLARFAHAMLQGGSPVLRPETVALFTRRESLPAGTSRALGWDTPSSPSQSGKYFGPHSYGHLGYTGTSLWIDPDRQLSITLLTNRTWPDCSNQSIKHVRPEFHDAIIEALER
jgi:serine-type D-Ala-D-Ala carboxypeptidase